MYPEELVIPMKKRPNGSRFSTINNN